MKLFQIDFAADEIYIYIQVRYLQNEYGDECTCECCMYMAEIMINEEFCMYRQYTIQ